jgi:hypothetical protein
MRNEADTHEKVSLGDELMRERGHSGLLRVVGFHDGFHGDGN